MQMGKVAEKWGSWSPRAGTDKDLTIKHGYHVSGLRLKHTFFHTYIGEIRKIESRKSRE